MSGNYESSAYSDDLRIGESLRNSFDKDDISVSEDLITATLNAIQNAEGSAAAEWNFADAADTADDDEPLFDVGYKLAEFAEEDMLSLETEMQKVVSAEVSDSLISAGSEQRHVWKPEIVDDDDVRNKSAARAVSLATPARRRRRSRAGIFRIGGTIAASLAVVALAGIAISGISAGGRSKAAENMAMQEAPASTTTADAGRIVDLRTKDDSGELLNRAPKVAETSADMMNDMDNDFDMTAGAYPETDGAGYAAAGIPNPLVSTDEDGIYNRLGFVMRAPENALDPVYFLINDSTAEERFMIDGTQYTARAAYSSSMIDISGMYYDWDDALTTEWQEDNTYFAIYMTTDHEAGVCLMFDSEAGVMFTISSQGHCTVETLREMVEEIHVTM